MRGKESERRGEESRVRGEEEEEERKWRRGYRRISRFSSSEVRTRTHLFPPLAALPPLLSPHRQAKTSTGRWRGRLHRQRSHDGDHT